MGGASSTACPAGHFPVNTAGACASAAEVANRMYGGRVEYSYYPAGCFWHTVTGTIYLNTYPFKDATGAANYYAQPVCAGAARPAHCR
jgi:hypothetical protein